MSLNKGNPMTSPWNPRAATLGAIPCVAIIPFMPDSWDAAAGFPAMKGNVAFLMKDVVLLAASLCLLKQDVVRAARSADERRQGREVGESGDRTAGQVAATSR
jgi:hypothetical protein